ncbi:MAG: YbhB/YbcL family Raf kinase inhibitor-like protein [Pseudomonadota bacterium]
MKLWSESFEDGGAIPADYAFGVIDPLKHVRLSTNRNPHLAWDDVPAGTESLVLFCFDIDAPTVGTDVNQEGRSVPFDLPRADFYHWTLVDLPPTLGSIPAAAMSELVTPRGKHGPDLGFNVSNGTEHTLRHGLNDYTGWFAGDAAMAGEYFGYDGPCPPWNDTRVHNYIFRLYALDLPRLEVEGKFTGPDARRAIHGHILDEAQITGVYSLNPALAATLT